jgi:hypothetical protein
MFENNSQPNEIVCLTMVKPNVVLWLNGGRFDSFQGAKHSRTAFVE